MSKTPKETHFSKSQNKGGVWYMNLKTCVEIHVDKKMYENMCNVI